MSKKLRQPNSNVRGKRGLNMELGELIIANNFWAGELVGHFNDGPDSRLHVGIVNAVKIFGAIFLGSLGYPDSNVVAV